MEATDASRLVCVVVVSYQEHSLTHTSTTGLIDRPLRAGEIFSFESGGPARTRYMYRAQKKFLGDERAKKNSSRFFLRSCSCRCRGPPCPSFTFLLLPPIWLKNIN